MNDLAASDTAYPHRDQQVLAIASSFPPSGIGELSQAARPLWAHAGGAYRNFESHPTEATFDRAFGDLAGTRVLKLAKEYDPEGLFSSGKNPSRRLPTEKLRWG